MKKILTTKLVVVFSLLSVCSQGAYSADESNQSIQSSDQKKEKSSWWQFWKQDRATSCPNDGQKCLRGDGKRKMSADNQTEEKGSRRAKSGRGKKGYGKGRGKRKARRNKTRRNKEQTSLTAESSETNQE